eukprot:1147662-Pelagomonas_calceolata.AAC.2
MQEHHFHAVLACILPARMLAHHFNAAPACMDASSRVLHLHILLCCTDVTHTAPVLLRLCLAS